MKENPSPGPRKQHVFAPKRPVGALLVMMVVALSFALLFAFAGQPRTASASARSTSDYTRLVVNLVTPENPSNASPNIPLTLLAFVNAYGPNETIARVEFYDSIGGSTLTLISTTSVPFSINPFYEITWTPSVAGTYSLVAVAYDTLGNFATSPSVTVNVVVGTPPTLPPPTPVIAITSPSKGVYTLPAQIPFTAAIDDVVESDVLFYVVSFYATLEPNGPTYDVGGSTQATPGEFTFTWVPPQAGLYSLKVTGYFSSGVVGNQSGASTPILVQINAPQTSPTPQISPTIPSSGACKVNYQLESQWSGGVTVNVVVTNTSPISIHGWTLAFTFPGDQKITELWNGSFAQTGEQVSITNLSYNGTIMPGGTVNLGFNGAWVRNDTSPMLFTLNGMTCST